MPQVSSTWNNVYRVIPPKVDYWRSMLGGVCISNRGYGKELQYIEFGQLAHIHATIAIETENSQRGTLDIPDVTRAYAILSYIDITLEFAYMFLEAIRYSWPITVNVVFDCSYPIKINYIIPSNHNLLHMNYLSDSATDEKLPLLNVEIAPSQLTTEKSLMLSTAHNLFWAFGLGWDKSRVSQWLEATVSKKV